MISRGPCREHRSAGNTDKKVEVEIPADADIWRDGRAAGLDDLDAGDQVTITRSDRGTQVVAFDGDHGLSFLRHP